MELSSARKLWILGACYAAQGVPQGFFVQALPVLLRRAEVSTEDIGLSAVLALPWAVKPVWAALLGGRRLRRLALLLQACVAVACGLLVFVPLDGGDPSAVLPMLAAAVLAVNVVAATHDVSVDGLAVARLADHERGLGSGVQVAAYRAGMIVGGGGLLVVLSRASWAAACATMSLVVLLTMLPLALAPRFDAHAEAGTSPLRDLVGWWTQPGALAWAALLVALKVGDYVAQGMLRPWLVDLGRDVEHIGWSVGGLAFLMGGAGAVLGGVLVPTVGPRRSVVVWGLAQALILAGYARLAAGGVTDGWVDVWVIAEHAVSGALTACVFAGMMSASRRTAAAADFGTQASVVVVASIAGHALGGWVQDDLGYVGTFALAAALSLWVPVLALWRGTWRIHDTVRGAA